MRVKVSEATQRRLEHLDPGQRHRLIRSLNFKTHFAAARRGDALKFVEWVERQAELISLREGDIVRAIDRIVGAQDDATSPSPMEALAAELRGLIAMLRPAIVDGRVKVRFF